MRIGLGRRSPERHLATVLFIDIARSTELAAEIGDAAWKMLLGRYYAAIRERLRRHDGRQIDTAGDGLFAAFGTPAAAVACALEIRDAAAGLGLTVRAGIHMGEVEWIEGKVGGIAVHIGARIAGVAAPGEILVSSTVRDVVTGSGLRFEARGEVALKGVPGEWRLFLVQSIRAGSPVATTSRAERAPGTQRRRPLVVTATAVGLLIAAIAVGSILSTQGSGRSNVSPSPSPAGGSTLASPVLASGSLPVVPTLQWTVSRAGDPFTGATVSGLGAAGDGFMAVGSVEAGGAPIVWDTPGSASGAWTPIGTSDVFREAVLDDAANPDSSSRFAIVGERCPSGPASCRAAAWWSSDPDRPSLWQVATLEAGSDPPGSRITGIGVGGPGFVAVGSAPSGNGRQARVWTSADGATWEPAILGGDALDAEIRDVAGGDAGLVAVGTSGGSGAIWTSTDGNLWRRVATGDAFKGVSLVSVTRTFGGYLAIGNRPTGGGAWWSPDGISWTDVPGLPHLEGTFTRVSWSPQSGIGIVATSPDGPVFVGAIDPTL